MGRCRRDGRLGGRPRAAPVAAGSRPGTSPSASSSFSDTCGPGGTSRRPGASIRPLPRRPLAGRGRAGSCRSRCRPRDGTSCGRWGSWSTWSVRRWPRDRRGCEPAARRAPAGAASRSSSSSCWVSRSRPWSAGLHDGGWTAHRVTGAALLGLRRRLHACGGSLRPGRRGAAKREVVEEDDESGGDTRQGVHDVYLYLHLPIAVSLAAVAVGLEYAVLHAGEERSDRWTALGAGRSACRDTCSAARVIQAAMSRGARGPLLWPGAGVPAVLVIAWFDPAPLVLLGSERPPSSGTGLGAGHRQNTAAAGCGPPRCSARSAIKVGSGSNAA